MQRNTAAIVPRCLNALSRKLPTPAMPTPTLSSPVSSSSSSWLGDSSSASSWRGWACVSGSLPASDGSHSLYCAVIVKRVTAETRAKTSINELLRN